MARMATAVSDSVRARESETAISSETGEAHATDARSIRAPSSAFSSEPLYGTTDKYALATNAFQPEDLRP